MTIVIYIEAYMVLCLHLFLFSIPNLCKCTLKNSSYSPATLKFCFVYIPLVLSLLNVTYIFEINDVISSPPI